MSNTKHPFSALLQPLIDEMATNRLEPPRRKNRNHPVTGTWLLVTGVYRTQDFMVRSNIDIPGLVTTLIGHPHSNTSALGAPVICCTMALFGCLSLVDGVRNERAPHDFVGVLCLFCVIGGSTYALVAGVYLDNNPIASSYLRASTLRHLPRPPCSFSLSHAAPGTFRSISTRANAAMVERDDRAPAFMIAAD